MHTYARESKNKIKKQFSSVTSHVLHTSYTPTCKLKMSIFTLFCYWILVIEYQSNDVTKTKFVKLWDLINFASVPNDWN